MSDRIRFHPAVAGDLDAIARWIVEHAGPEAAERRLAEIEAVLASLRDTPHKGSNLALDRALAERTARGEASG